MVRKVLYRFIIRPLLWLLPAETAHHVAFGLLRACCRIPGVRGLLTRLFEVRDPVLELEVLGRRFASPVGLAAGFDKDARGFEALLALGFGFVEVGTLTGSPQPGNPRPRLFRLPRDRALINRMGFNNQGSAAAVPRLGNRRGGIVGVNLGKTKSVPEEEAERDYAVSAERLGALADYVVVNVSSPNTPGLRNLQAVDKLRPVLEAVQAALARAGASPPLLVKIAPDLADDDIDRVADLAVELGLAGIIATNTTVSREALHTDSKRVETCGAGGLSGAPLKARATEVLWRLHKRAGKRLVLIAAGGIETAEDAWVRIRAGASLVQVYTAFVYDGPSLPSRIAQGLAARTRQAGYASIQDVIGTEEPGQG